jgi:hypothetical protein
LCIIHFSRVFSVIVAQNSKQNGLTFYVGIPNVTILAPPLGVMRAPEEVVHKLQFSVELFHGGVCEAEFVE